jgi:hypothetical protein
MGTEAVDVLLDAMVIVGKGMDDDMAVVAAKLIPDASCNDEKLLDNDVEPPTGPISKFEVVDAARRPERDIERALELEIDVGVMIERDFRLVVIDVLVVPWISPIPEPYSEEAVLRVEWVVRGTCNEPELESMAELSTGRTPATEDVEDKLVPIANGVAEVSLDTSSTKLGRVRVVVSDVGFRVGRVVG